MKKNTFGSILTSVSNAKSKLIFLPDGLGSVPGHYENLYKRPKKMNMKNEILHKFKEKFSYSNKDSRRKEYKNNNSTDYIPINEYNRSYHRNLSLSSNHQSIKYEEINQTWRTKYLFALEKLKQEQQKCKVLLSKLDDLKIFSNKLLSMLSMTQRKTIMESSFSNELIKCMSLEPNATIGDLHMLYQNLYVNDMKEQLMHLDSINTTQRMSMLILQDKLKKSAGEVYKLKSKLKTNYKSVGLSQESFKDYRRHRNINYLTNKNQKALDNNYNEKNAKYFFEFKSIFKELNKCENIGQFCDKLLQ